MPETSHPFIPPPLTPSGPGYSSDRNQIKPSVERKLHSQIKHHPLMAQTLPDDAAAPPARTIGNRHGTKPDWKQTGEK